MPKLWTDTIESHRQEVRDAVLDAASAVAAGQGILGVTMSAVAEQSGIGRATLYKYFPDVESVLAAWHERTVSRHVDRIARVANRPGPPATRLHAVLDTYARLIRETHSPAGIELVARLSHGRHLAESHHRLHHLLAGVVAEAAAAGTVRADTTPDELVAYCLHALGAARDAGSTAAVGRLVRLTIDGLRAHDHGADRLA